MSQPTEESNEPSRATRRSPRQISASIRVGWGRLDDAARKRAVPIAVATFVALVVLKQAWISDDALATARTVANWQAGYGPNFNIGESAQAFTSPLWFLLTAAGSWVLKGDILVTMIALGVAASAAGAYLLARDLTLWWQAALLTIPLVSSVAITDFATSGLENPLLFILVVAAWHQARAEHFIAATIAAGLLVIGRYDMIIVVAPAMLYAAYRVWRRNGKRLWRLVAAAVLPLVSWFIFSFVVYGSGFPETAYAKLNLIIPRREILGQGLGYLVESFLHDWVTFGLVIVAILAILSRTVAGYTRSLAAGAVLYLFYVVWVGGDFMVGRFVFVPATIGAIVLTEALPGIIGHSEPKTSIFGPNRHLGALTIATLVVGLIGLATLLQEVHPVTEHPLQTVARWPSGERLHLGITDERRIQVEHEYGLWSWLLLEPYDSTFSNLRKALREWPSGAVVSEVRIQCGALGTESVVQGPSVHYVDSCGKADPFLARHIPFEASEGDWRVGHYRREIPAGYIEALVSGDARFLDEVHRQAFEAISLSRRIEERWPQDPASVKTP